MWGSSVTMPDIYDPDRGLIISLTDDDYEDYQDGKLSEDFYARRTDGAIANRVDISRLDDDSDDDGEPSDGMSQPAFAPASGPAKARATADRRAGPAVRSRRRRAAFPVDVSCHVNHQLKKHIVR